MKITNKPLLDLDGEPLKEVPVVKVEEMLGFLQSPMPDDAKLSQAVQFLASKKSDPKPITVASVLINVALTPPPVDQPYSSAKNAERYSLALELHRTPLEETAEVSLELAADLRKDVMRLYAPIIAGNPAFTDVFGTK